MEDENFYSPQSSPVPPTATVIDEVEVEEDEFGDFAMASNNNAPVSKKDLLSKYICEFESEKDGWEFLVSANILISTPSDNNEDEESIEGSFIEDCDIEEPPHAVMRWRTLASRAMGIQALNAIEHSSLNRNSRDFDQTTTTSTTTSNNSILLRKSQSSVELKSNDSPSTGNSTEFDVEMSRNLVEQVSHSDLNQTSLKDLIQLRDQLKQMISRANQCLISTHSQSTKLRDEIASNNKTIERLIIRASSSNTNTNNNKKLTQLRWRQ